MSQQTAKLDKDHQLSLRNPRDALHHGECPANTQRGRYELATEVIGVPLVVHYQIGRICNRCTGLVAMTT